MLKDKKGLIEFSIFVAITTIGIVAIILLAGCESERILQIPEPIDEYIAAAPGVGRYIDISNITSINSEYIDNNLHLTVYAIHGGVEYIWKHTELYPLLTGEYTELQDGEEFVAGKYTLTLDVSESKINVRFHEEGFIFLPSIRVGKFEPVGSSAPIEPNPVVSNPVVSTPIPTSTPTLTSIPIESVTSIESSYADNNLHLTVYATYNGIGYVWTHTKYHNLLTGEYTELQDGNEFVAGTYILTLNVSESRINVKFHQGGSVFLSNIQIGEIGTKSTESESIEPNTPVVAPTSQPTSTSTPQLIISTPVATPVSKGHIVRIVYGGGFYSYNNDGTVITAWKHKEGVKTFKVGKGKIHRVDITDNRLVIWITPSTQPSARHFYEDNPKTPIEDESNCVDPSTTADIDPELIHFYEEYKAVEGGYELIGDAEDVVTGTLEWFEIVGDYVTGCRDFPFVGQFTIE